MAARVAIPPMQASTRRRPWSRDFPGSSGEAGQSGVNTPENDSRTGGQNWRSKRLRHGQMKAWSGSDGRAVNLRDHPGAFIHREKRRVQRHLGRSETPGRVRDRRRVGQQHERREVVIAAMKDVNREGDSPRNVLNVTRVQDAGAAIISGKADSMRRVDVGVGPRFRKAGES
jgi:hypothetical protein